MARLSTALQATTTTELDIKPTLKTKLVKALKGWAEQHAAEKAAAEKKAGHAKTVLDTQVELGETHIEVAGFKSTVTAPKGRRTLDRKKFVRLGGNLEILDKSYVEGDPGAAYPKITAPGMKEQTYE